MLAETSPHETNDTRDEVRSAGLVYVCLDEPGLARRRAGKGFAYRGPDRAHITDVATVQRIRALAIPPAWRNVWICANDNGHIQAVGYDDRGRKQYRYHARFRALRDSAKFDHLLTFAEGLPALRERVAADMQGRGFGRDKVLATVVYLLETTMIRVGNPSYAKENGSYGLTTLRGRHVQIDGSELKLHFKGKGGKVWRLGVRDRRVARIVRACQELPGQNLFQYLDDDGQPQAVASSDVNAYLKQASGRDITAKDFRTWTGTVAAASALAEAGPANTLAQAKASLAGVVKRVAARLGNTPTICRKCYIHPVVMSAYLDGQLELEPVSAPAGDQAPLQGLRPEETAVLNFLRARAPSAQAEVIAGSWPDRNTADE